MKTPINCPDAQIAHPVVHLVAKHQTVNGFVRGQMAWRYERMSVVAVTFLLAGHLPDARRVANPGVLMQKLPFNN